MPEKRMKSSDKEYVSTGQAAELCSVTPDTVLKWIKSGKVPANRTPGGHYRINKEIMQNIIETESLQVDSGYLNRPFQFCWEYYKSNGGISEKCQECIVYRSRATRCYEMIKLPEESGHARVFCQGSCDDCEYFRVVKGQRINLLVVTDNKALSDDLEKQAGDVDFNLRLTENEYHCSMVVENFRPDYVVIDAAMGQERCRDFAQHLSEDPRVPYLKIIIAGGYDDIPSECNKMIFAVIDSPFTLGEFDNLVSLARQEVVNR
jgi:excisionase family DNA binding protein